MVIPQGEFEQSPVAVLFEVLAGHRQQVARISDNLPYIGTGRAPLAPSHLVGVGTEVCDDVEAVVDELSLWKQLNDWPA